MAAEDCITVMSITDGEVTYQFTEYRVDYNDDRPVHEFINPDEYDVSLKTPPAGYDGHLAKPNYQRKALVSGSDAKQFVSDLESTFEDASDGDGIGYVTESIVVDDTEKQALRDYGAMNALQAHDALKWAQAIEDLEAEHISMVEFQRGRNPHRGYEFGGPDNKDLGVQLARSAPRPGTEDRYDHPDPIEMHDST
jgi:hypothetical protein